MITALISLFHPSASVTQNVEAIAAQVDTVYLCDNSPVSNFHMFAGLDTRANIHYTCSLENLGLSAAFNRVLRNRDIPWQDDDFIFFFDQDSQIAQGHVEKMCSVYRDLQAHRFAVGCLGCIFFNTVHGAVEIPRAEMPLLEGTNAVPCIITSSMLTTYGNLKSVGFWNEHVFLDMADWDLCWRLKASGKLCCITESVILRHSIGNAEKKIGPVMLREGRPVREYYQIRECLYLLGQRYTPLKYRILFLLWLLVRCPMHILFLNQGKQRARFIWRGIRDFIRNRQGVIDPEYEKKINSL